MQPKSRLFRIFSRLLVIVLTGLILGSPLICVAQGHAAAALMPESEDAADSESEGIKLDVSAFPSSCGDFDIFTPRAYENRVTDDLTSTDAAFADLHLQRGPPAR